MQEYKDSSTPFGRAMDTFEETVIALILGLMTLITFAAVIVRYVFSYVKLQMGWDWLPGTILWALEATSFLFAWLVILGVSYAVKKGANLGVDAITNMLDPKLRRTIALVAGAICIVYAFLLTKGAWDYWANFANLPQTSGRWFPTGFEEMGRSSFRSWYEVNDIPMPEFLRWIEPLINEGEAYEKLPRFIPYAVLPFGMALLLYRFIEATILIWRGETDRLIVAHEADDADPIKD